MNVTSESKIQEQLVSIPAGSAILKGILAIPQKARGIVLFAHGSGSTRLSPRNQYVAKLLQEEGLATLLFDLLTPSEQAIDLRTMNIRFDLGLLAERLVSATDWLTEQELTRHLRVGYFGASTGGGAALLAATERPESVVAIVSRGGRPDLAGTALTRVQAPTLLIVGEYDLPVIRLNQEALALLDVDKQLKIVAGATHLFDEPGTLEEVAGLAGQWFKRYL
jgi:dienelactone hydrolase